jgi:hypothetical protein
LGISGGKKCRFSGHHYIPPDKPGHDVLGTVDKLQQHPRRA